LFAFAFLLLASLTITRQGAARQQPDGDPPAVEQTDSGAPGAAEASGILLEDFRPEPKLRVRETLLRSARFPVVDVHTHMFYRQRHNQQALDDFIALMDRNQIAVCVSLDGKLGGQLEEHLAFLWREHKNRFVVFAHLDWMGDGVADRPETWACNRPGWAQRTAVQLAEAKQAGISGIKVFKRLGLEYRDADGNLIKIDDPMLDPIWQACGELELPVLIHTADPSAFFDPLSPRNERWEELSRHPDWHFYGEAYPSRESLLAARNRVIEKHPRTKFIGAHVASSSEDLQQAGEWLDRYPNLWLDPASRISELGRQPYSARDFLIKYADRILFGTDGPWPETRVHYYWRFFETRDEYFPYSEKEFPPQGFWRIYGVNLPDDVLRKIYFENACALIPGVEERISAWQNR
jgi:predicted TIM-barrel fold metal-dependent hydrolase